MTFLFLEVYGAAHIEAFTEVNILASFKKTGIHPFNPSVISAHQMEPSTTSSTCGTLPIPLPSPVKKVVAIINDMTESVSATSLMIDPHSQLTIEPVPNQGNQLSLDVLDPSLWPCPPQTPISTLHEALDTPSLQFLVSMTPMRSNHQLLPIVYEEVPCIPQLTPIMVATPCRVSKINSSALLSAY